MTEAGNPQARRWGRAAAAFAAPLLLLVAALSFPPTAQWIRQFETGDPLGRDVSGENRHPAFSLLDVTGRRRQLSEFQGRLALVSFGYTHCPDACPTNLARLAKALALLGTDASKAQVVFITIDPERDSAATLDAYARTFDPTFLGLRGNAEETEEAAQSFHASYRIVKYGSSVLVEHTVDTYVVDSQGLVQVALPYDLDAEDVARDIRRILLKSGLCAPWSGLLSSARESAKTSS